MHETTLRQQLRRQAAAYGDHLAEVLRVQAVELDNRFVWPLVRDYILSNQLAQAKTFLSDADQLEVRQFPS